MHDLAERPDQGWTCNACVEGRRRPLALLKACSAYCEACSAPQQTTAGLTVTCRMPTSRGGAVKLRAPPLCHALALLTALLMHGMCDEWNVVANSACGTLQHVLQRPSRCAACRRISGRGCPELRIHHKHNGLHLAWRGPDLLLGCGQGCVHRASRKPSADPRQHMRWCVGC
jgi:hypothetical protein